MSVVSLRVRDYKDHHVRDTCLDLEDQGLAEIEVPEEPVAMG